jgi:hypothetical protein
MAWPRGNPYLPPLEVLDHAPFADFFVPGLLLAGVVGLVNLVAAVLVGRRHRVAELAGLAAGLTLLVWLVVEIAMLRGFHWLHGLYLFVALATIVTGATLGARRRAAARGEVGREISSGRARGLAGA